MLKSFCEGIRIPFGSPNTPVDMGLTRRFDPHNARLERFGLFLPTHGIPQTLSQNRPREASPTGKSGMGIATYSVAYQPVESAQRMFIMTKPDARYKGEGSVITYGVVDPYASLIGSIQPMPVGTIWTG